MAIPKEIKTEHIRSAINEIDSNGIPRNRSYDRYYLSINGNRYPVKYVISLAHKFTAIRQDALTPNLFNTYEAQDYLSKLGYVIDDKYTLEVDQYWGFKLLNLNVFGNGLLGDIEYSFVDTEDKQDKLYSTVIIGPNGTGKSNLFRVIIELFRELYTLSKGGNRTYNIAGRFDLKYALNGDTYNYTNMVAEDIAKSLNTKEEKAMAFLLRNGEVADFTEALFPIAIVASSIMLTDKYPVLQKEDTSFPMYKYLGLRNTPQNASTRSYVRRTVDYIVQEKDSNTFRSGLAKVTDFLGINKEIEVYYSTINGPMFFRGEATSAVFAKYFEDIEEKYKNESYPPQKLNVYQRIVKEPNHIQKLCDFINGLHEAGRLLWVRKGSSVRKISYNIIEEKSFQLLKAESLLLDDLRALGLLYSPEINLKKAGDYNLQESSSGEYHFFSSMVSLMATVKSNTLIFLDEPEISLHPNWQMKYLAFIRTLFSDPNYATCHLLVATHSHFLISDLKGDNSKIIGLKKAEPVTEMISNKRFEIVDMPKNVDTFGWSAEDVLYNIFDVPTVRNKYVADLIGNILDDLSKGDKSKINKLSQERYQVLTRLQENLKDIDPLKQVVNTILKNIE
jgi:predicted ATPase